MFIVKREKKIGKYPEKIRFFCSTLTEHTRFLSVVSSPRHISDLQAGNQPQMTMINVLHQHLCRLPCQVTSEKPDKTIILQKALNYLGTIVTEPQTETQLLRERGRIWSEGKEERMEGTFWYSASCTCVGRQKQQEKQPQGHFLFLFSLGVKGAILLRENQRLVRSRGRRWRNNEVQKMNGFITRVRQSSGAQVRLLCLYYSQPKKGHLACGFQPGPTTTTIISVAASRLREAKEDLKSSLQQTPIFQKKPQSTILVETSPQQLFVFYVSFQVLSNHFFKFIFY